MTLTRTDDKLDKNITRLLMQSPLGLTIGDITAAAKCTPQTARKSLARIGADKDASGMLYVLRDDDEQASEAAPEPEQAAPEPAPEAQMPKSSDVWIERWGGCGYLNPYAGPSPTEPTDPEPAAAQKPLRRGDLVEYDGRVCVVAEIDPEDGDCWVAALTGEHGYDRVPADELKRIGSVRKKVKRLKAAIAKAGGEV